MTKALELLFQLLVGCIASSEDIAETMESTKQKGIIKRVTSGKALSQSALLRGVLSFIF